MLRFVTLFLFLTFQINLLAIDYIGNKIVGKRPVAFMNDSKSLNIVCAGWDSNYNNIFESDSGDVKPSWWKLDNTESEPYLFKEFDFPALDIPFRPLQYGNEITFRHGNKIVTYDLSNLNEESSIEFDDQATSISRLNDELFITARVDKNMDWQLDTNLLIILDANTLKALDTVPSEPYVIQALPFEDETGKYICVINEGNFGSNDSKLVVFKHDDDEYEKFKEFELGSGANHILRYESTLIITVGGSSKILLISTFNWSITEEITIPVEAWDSPRETILLAHSGLICISAWDGNVYYKNLGSAEPLAKIKSDGKPEGMRLYFGKIITANPYITGTYQPNDTISIFSQTTNIAFENENSISIYPNPAADKIFLNSPNQDFPNDLGLEVLDIFGNKLLNFDGYQLKDGLDISGLISGSYYLIAKSKTDYQYYPFLKH